MTEPLVIATDLTRRFRTFLAVDGVCLDLEPGSIYGLVGPNGAGKTTLLHLIAGLLEPSQGEAKLLGEPSRSPTRDRSLVAYVSDRAQPHAWCAIADLMDLQKDACSRFETKRFRDLIEERQLDEKATWKSLSKGQRRWVLVSLALASRPKVLLMDEPADGLDLEGKRSLYGHLRDLVTDENATALVSSHVFGDLQRSIDNVVVIRRGTVCLNAAIDVLRDEVREVVIRPVLDGLPVDDRVVTLASDESDDGLRLWMRSATPTVFDEWQRNPDLDVRPLDFEAFYLSLANGDTNFDDDPSHRSSVSDSAHADKNINELVGEA